MTQRTRLSEIRRGKGASVQWQRLEALVRESGEPVLSRRAHIRHGHSVGSTLSCGQAPWYQSCRHLSRVTLVQGHYGYEGVIQVFPGTKAEGNESLGKSRASHLLTCFHWGQSRGSPRTVRGTVMNLTQLWCICRRLARTESRLRSNGDCAFLSYHKNINPQSKEICNYSSISLNGIQAGVPHLKSKLNEMK